MANRAIRTVRFTFDQAEYDKMIARQQKLEEAAQLFQAIADEEDAELEMQQRRNRWLGNEVLA